MGEFLAILGAGESGVGVALLAKQKGWKVFVSDAGSIKPNYEKELKDNGIEYEKNAHSEPKILSADLIIISPGIPDKAPLVKKIISKNIPLISEIEFGAKYTDAKLIGITGTNGKTTTTLLTFHIFSNAGLNVGLAGNIGKSFARQIAEDDKDFYILELSSFQLDRCFELHLSGAVITNITPDHLDRYDYKIENYTDSKFRILQNMTSDDVLVLSADSPLISNYLIEKNISQPHYLFSTEQKMPQGASFYDGLLQFNIQHDHFSINPANFELEGKHNYQNIMASSILAYRLGIPSKQINEAVASFKNIPHRMEMAGVVNGVKYINDSKATNVDAAKFALEAIKEPIIWIAGGVDKGNKYEDLDEIINTGKVKTLICLGKDNQKLVDYYTGKIAVIKEASSAMESIEMAYNLSQPGDCVLLSPCCASFDLFNNYEDRGDQFKEAVKVISNKMITHKTELY